ncbi:hypothetical protein GALMADRAFT_146387 [Galerina marginata CBS 339.88]|uniref:Phosphoglycerate mutase-like protein n=1 Tax=Galerina marginata (strain CBS 339.88) TaxID=685588 RepID=A0A067SC01_GALM3|nr:hypothetical protein GALMADRAFT_146387 [Galerina marginata CBS 339.88]
MEYNGVTLESIQNCLVKESAVANDLSKQPFSTKTIHIIRHGEALHNIDRAYKLRDPPLTDKGLAQAEALSIQLSTVLKIQPSAIVTSPMTRTIQTCRTLFPSAFTDGPDARAIPLHIWPDLREAHDANCNKGRSRAEMRALHPDLDFSACHEEWDYPAHSFEDAAIRAEAVRKELMKLPGSHIVVVGHRGLIAYMVDTKEVKFRNCEIRSYRFANAEELENRRYGVHELQCEYDFGPSLLVEVPLA